MPKASSQSSKALKSGFGIQEGIVKVIGACFLMHQFTNKDGDPALTFFGHRFDVVKCDESGETESDESVPQYFIVQIVGKDEDGEPKYDKLKFHPGNAKSATDDDPEDLGVEIGTEGNTMYCETTSAPFQDADWIEFCKSLESKGWKPEINDQSYAPNYIGAVFKIHTETKPLNPKAKADAKPQTKWVVDQIYVRPYEGKGKKGGTTASKNAQSPAGAGKSSTTTSPSNDAGADSDATAEAFRAALQKLIDNPAAATKATSKALADGVELNAFYRAVANEASLSKLNGKPIPGATQRNIIVGMKQYSEDDGGWIEQNNGGVVTVDREKGVVQAV